MLERKNKSQPKAKGLPRHSEFQPSSSKEPLTDEDLKKKKTVTSWRLRRRFFLLSCLFIAFLTLIALTSFGYHRRHHNKLTLNQRKAWYRFIRPKKVKFREAGFSKKDALLAKDRKIAAQWQTHLKQNAGVAELFKEDVEPYWNPGPNDPVGQFADQLGSTAEKVTEWFQEDIIKPVMGGDSADFVGGLIHDTINTMGELTDDATDWWGEVGEPLLDTVGTLLDTTMEATVETVMEWMGNSTDWSDWTESLSRVTSSFPSLWNFTMEDIDDEEDDADDANKKEDSKEKERKTDVPKIGTRAVKKEKHAATDETDENEVEPADEKKEDHEGPKTTRAVKKEKPRATELPEFMTKNARLKKYAFVTTGFPNQEKELWRFEAYVLGALNTYLKNTVMFYIANSQGIDALSQVCALNQNQVACRRLIFVEVACPSNQHGVSTCCRQDRGMARIASNYPDFDWYIYHQDDLYFRLPYLNTFVRGLQNPHNTSLLLSASPFQSLGGDPLMVSSNGNRSSMNCSSSPNHIYPWGWPAVIYSNAALQALKSSYFRLAISRECDAFHVPADSASPIVHWMHQIPVVKLPDIASRTYKNLDTRLSSPAPYFRKFLAFRADVQQYNFTELHRDVQIAARDMQKKGGTVIPQPPYTYRLHHPIGFEETALYKKHGAVQTWKRWNTFTPQDCVNAEAIIGKNLVVDATLKKSKTVSKTPQGKSKPEGESELETSLKQEEEKRNSRSERVEEEELSSQRKITQTKPNQTKPEKRSSGPEKTDSDSRSSSSRKQPRKD